MFSSCQRGSLDEAMQQLLSRNGTMYWPVVRQHHTVGQIRGDEAHFRFCEFGTPSGHFGPKLTAWDRLGLFRTILERYGPFLTILDQFWTILDLFDHFGPVGPNCPK